MTKKLDWRKHLTDDERIQIEAADKARVAWEKLNATRAGIVNRAIHRAKYREGLKSA